MATRRIRYNRGDLDDTIRAARRVATTTSAPRYVYATFEGFAIGTQPPPFGQRHLIVTATTTQEA